MPHDLCSRARALFAAASLSAAALALGGAAHAAQAPDFDPFRAADPASTIRIDYSFLDAFLGETVFDVGHSDRRPALAPSQQTGSRVRRDSNSRYRFENNRVLLHLLEDDRIAALTEYRAELESLPAHIPLDSLNRDEQLAYWLNLHNVVVFEELARAYPVRRIDRFDPLGDGVPLHDAPIVRINGEALSLNDIRFNIVQAGWNDPRVIYGFFSGAVGGPALQDRAFQGATVWTQLDQNAREFVNALRGVDRSRRTTLVSPVYFDHRDLFETWPQDLTAHLRRYASADTAGDIRTGSVQPLRYDWNIADMTNGRNACGADPNGTMPGLSVSTSGVVSELSGVCDALPPQAQQLLEVVIARRLEFLRQGRIGSVTVRDLHSPDPDDPDAGAPRRLTVDGEAVDDDSSR